jgi:tetratricopeptide (TPR) repeat protein
MDFKSFKSFKSIGFSVYNPIRQIVREITIFCQYGFYCVYHWRSPERSLKIAQFWLNYGDESRAIACYQRLLLKSFQEELALQALIDIYTDRNQWSAALQARLIKLGLKELPCDPTTNIAQIYHQKVIVSAILTAQEHFRLITTKTGNNTQNLKITQPPIRYENHALAIALSLLAFDEQDAAFNTLLYAIEANPDESWDKTAYIFFQLCQKHRSLSNYKHQNTSDTRWSHPWDLKLHQCLYNQWKQQPNHRERQLNYAEILLRIGQREEANKLCMQAAKNSLIQNYPAIYHDVEPLKEIVPSFAIIGTMKSGSTSLYQYLLQHNHVLPLARKELDYWSWRYVRGSDWFLSHFPQVPVSREFIAGDASPTYFQHDLAPQRMLEAYPNFKVIVVLRNPVDRTISHHYHNARRASDLRPLDVAITQQIEAIQNNSYDPRRLDNAVASSLYVSHLQRWQRCFSPDRILTILSDDLFAYPQQVLDQVFQFLGLQTQIIPDLSPRNVGAYSSKDSEQRQRLKHFFYPSICELERLCQFQTHWY